jgi:hypothetical protein
MSGWSVDAIPAEGSADWWCANPRGALKMAELKLGVARGGARAKLRALIDACRAADDAAMRLRADSADPVWCGLAEKSCAATWALVRFAAPL